ncbi:UNVERIFIED_CONTAM: hypothetical protein Q9R58_24950 [Methylobacteriaceae bacterium AG10]|nr:hypothetical protein [Methylobacteriaceae bacterium AG10]
MVDSVGPSGGGFSGGDIGGIGSSGLSSFDLGGIAPNGGGPAPTGTGALGEAGLSPIGSTGLTAFGLDGPNGGPSEATKLDHYDSLVQQNSAQLAANQQRNADLSQSIAAMGQPSTPPAFTMPPVEPLHLPSPPTFPTFALPPPAADPAPLPTPPAFAGQPLDASGFTPPAPTAPTFALPEAAGAPVPAAPKLTDLPAPIPPAPFTPFAMAPDALASPVTRPDIAAPVAAVDPFAPVAAGGLGLSPIGSPALTAFGPGGPVPAAAGAGLPPATDDLAAFATVPLPIGAPEMTASVPPTDPALPPWTPFAETPPAPAPALQETTPAPVPAEQPSYLAGLIDAAGQGRALSFMWDRYQKAVQARDGAALPSLSSVFNGVMNGSTEAGQHQIDSLVVDLDWFNKVANGTVSLTDPETGMISDEAIRRGLNLASLG